MKAKSIMLKTLTLMLIAIVSATFGDIFMSLAMKGIGEIKITGVRSFWEIAVRIICTPRVQLATACLAVSFFLWMYVLSWADLTYVLPLTALTYVFNAFLAPPMLGEHVGGVRWAGVVLIALGVALVGFSETLEKKSEAARNPAVVETTASIL